MAWGILPTLADFKDHGFEQAAFDVKTGIGRQATENSENLLFRALVSSDGPHQDADGTMGTDFKAGRSHACGGVVGEEQGTRMIESLIQVNQGTGVTDDKRARGDFNRFHGGPTGYHP